MNELSDRFHQAVDFVKRNGYDRSDAAIARRMGVTASTICMASNGTRQPAPELLLAFCDHYPIDFRWLWTGKGNMLYEDRELMLLKRIEELEKTIEQLRE